jgi:hypothetical protein
MGDEKETGPTVELRKATGHVRIEHMSGRTRVFINGLDISDSIMAVEWDHEADGESTALIRVMVDRVVVIEKAVLVEVVKP